MEIICLVADRKEMIAAIEETTGEKMKYQGPPTFAYKNEDLMVLRDGTLVVENIETRMELLLTLTSKRLIDGAWDEDREVLEISLPMEGHTGLSLINLVSIFYTKAELINKAINAPRAFEVNARFIAAIMEEPPQPTEEFISLWEECGSDNMTKGIKFEADKITFTGFPLTDDSDLITAFTTLAGKINTLALESKYIRVKKTPVDNEKYTFRILMVRLGLDGTEYKTTRKLLLSHLSGHSAFRTEEQKEAHKQKYMTKKANADEEA